MPAELMHLWGYYGELQNKEPITYTEIESWSRLTGRGITASEVEVLRTLDVIFWNEVHGATQPLNNPSKQQPSRGSRKASR